MFSSICLSEIAFPPPELDDLEHGHLANPENQNILAALGGVLLIAGLNVGEPLGADQALEVGLDLRLVERLPGPAEELRPDFLAGDRRVAFDPDFRDRSLGKPVPLLSTAARYAAFRTDHRQRRGA